MSEDQEIYLAVIKAQWDYEPQPDAEEELAIKEGQLLFLLERVDDDWWKVKTRPSSQEEEGQAGLVPAAYVEPAEHIQVVKALYDYEATQSTELTIKEDEILYVYDKDDAWLLVSSMSEEGRVGYIPETYVEEVSDDGASAPSAAQTSISRIVVPDTPARPVSVYVDPAERVAASRATSDDIQTWAVSEVDKKGKKKKGTLGVGNGAVFFASESDKTPVQKWPTVDIQSVKLEKGKHVHIDIGGAEPISLHFHAGAKDVGEAISSKLESSRALSAPASFPTVEEQPERPRSSAQKSVHFDAAEPEIIPARESSEYGAEAHEEPAAEEQEGETAVVLYDFNADGEDELSVQEGETLLVLERDNDEWWKCRNATGAEGVVPAQYVNLLNAAAAEPEEDTVAIAKAAQEEEKRAEARQRDEEAREKAEHEREEREAKKREAEERAKAAATAAEAERKRREREREKQKERERAAAEEETRKKKQRDSTSSPPSSPRKKSTSESGSRSSSDAKRGPPPENTRVWHDRTGQFRVEAAFLGYANGKLRLHKVNGVVIEVPSEKMSAEDLKYIEKMVKKQSPPRKSADDDDEPLEVRRRSLIPEARSTPPKSKRPTVDWFDFFLNAGCDLDDCTRYAASFERDKIDEAILPDITESTMRSLGLREGDIIRVKKAIEQRQPKASKDALAEQVRRDEELARQLQSEESVKRGQPPNLFSGSNGALKTNSVRRGRPQPRGSIPPSSVDLQSISTASDQIQRTGSPLVASPESVQPPRASSAAPQVASGFDDDAWTNRPSSAKPLTPTPAAAARAPSAPPASTPPPAPAAPVASPPPPAPVAAPAAPAPPPAPALAPVQAAPAPQPVAPPAQPQPTGSALAKTDNDIFEQLARLSQLRTQSPVVSSPVSNTSYTPNLPMSSPPPVSYQAGLGMGSSPTPMGQHLQAQQTGMLPPPQINGPRGPFAPVPANQSLLQPLIPTTTGFNSFVPTRPQSAQSPFANPSPQPPSFLSSQPTGFPGATQPMMPQMTGYPNPSPIMTQPTGISATGSFGPVGGGFGQPSFQNNSGFGQVNTNPTGFNPGFGQSPFGNGVSSPPPQPHPISNASTNPANIFAQMKSGTFANDQAPQSADKYDALRPNPILTTQPTGWNYGSNGFQGGYGYGN